MSLPTPLPPSLLAAFSDEVRKTAGAPVADVGHMISPELLKALPYVATAAGGALAYDQSTKAYNDWQQGRQMRLQQALYRQ